MGTGVSVGQHAYADDASTSVLSAASTPRSRGTCDSVRPLEMNPPCSPSRQDGVLSPRSGDSQADLSCVLLDSPLAFLAVARHGSPLLRLPSVWAEGAAAASNSDAHSRVQPTTTSPRSPSFSHPPGFHRLPPASADGAVEPRVFVSVASGDTPMPSTSPLSRERLVKSRAAVVSALSLSSSRSNSNTPLLNGVAHASRRKPVVTFGAAPPTPTQGYASADVAAPVPLLRLSPGSQVESGVVLCHPGASLLVPPTDRVGSLHRVAASRSDG